jgi:hypothetical protein
MSYKRYKNQSYSSKQRGVYFNLTYDEWMSLWKMAGLEPCKTHCVSRIKDAGGYVLGNVFIQTVSENSREASVRNKMAWKQKDIRFCVSLFLSGKNIKELSEIFSRPVGGVRNIIYKNIDIEDWQPRYAEQVKPFN